MKIAQKCIIVFLYGCDKQRILSLEHTAVSRIDHTANMSESHVDNLHSSLRVLMA